MCNWESISLPARPGVVLRWLAVFSIVASLAGGVLAQQDEKEILARARVFPDVSGGVRSIRRSSTGRYYILSAPGAAVGIYATDGTRVGQVPATPTKQAAIVLGDEIDLDTSGRLYVADRGAKDVKIFAPDGSLSQTIPAAAPTSVAALSGGEFAVASQRSKRLVEVFDGQGKKVRDFGELSDMAEHADLNRFLNVGRLLADAAGNLYYGFTYLPEPTIRKYDRFGYAAMEISVTLLEFQPAAQAERREIWRQDQRSAAPSFKAVISAFGVDLQTQQVWVALGDQLLQFDRDGNHRASYRTFTASGARIETVAILVEPDRLLLASDPLGIFDFARPDKPSSSAAHP